MAGGQAAPPAARTRVFFRFWDAAPVGTHESVRVLGSCTELGSWDLGSAVPLSRVEQCKGCWWTTHSVRIPLKQHFEYRYAIFHSETDDFIRWTKEGEEPLFAVATGRTLCLEDDNGRCRATGDDEAGQMSTVASRGASLAAEANSSSRPPSPSGYHGSQPTSPRSPASPRSGSCWNVRSKSMDLTQLCDVTSEDSAFLVFRSLPVVVKRAENGDWQVEKISHGAGTALPLLKHFTQTGVNKPPAGEAIDVSVKFIGHPGVCVRDDADRKQLTDLLAKHSCIPVFLDEDVVQKHNFFAEDYLWPVFHNMKIFDATITGDHEYESFDKALWKSFLNLNNAYAEVITTHGDENTLVWIHDYELVMVPRFVYHRNPDFTTGLFLHCAFPSTEVMSCLPVREDILQGMLSSRLVTFQTFDYLRHFMSCCSSVLGTRHSFQKGGILQVEHENRSVVVFADHFTVPYNHLIKKISDEKVVERAASIRNQFKGKTIIGAYDRFDCFSGLTLKLRTFHRFLQEYRSHRRSVVLVQYIRGRATDSKRKGMVSIEELRQMADATNKAFGVEGEPPLVTIVVEDTTREKQLGVLLATDILLDTSTNDGLNLIPFNFYAAHSQDQKGVALISEFCGCSSVLTGAFKINPWNTGAVLTALDQAISITPEDQALRFTKDHSYVSSQTLVQWVHKNLSELKVTRNSRELTYRASMAGPVHLPAEEVAAAYNAAKKRAIFLDNEGTIAAKQKWQIESTTMVALQKQGQPPDPYVVDLLQTLVNDRGNTVVVLSGRNKQVMEEWFGSVDGLGLFAEHGFHRLLPRTLREAQQQDGSERGWKSSAIADNNQEWKDLCIELMKQYVQRIQGSVLEAKACAISWNYREVGATGVIDDVALELVRFLDPEVPTGLLHGYPVKVIMGKGYVEVKRADVDKGRAVIQTLEELGSVDFVLSIGDDRSDEDMFEAISDYFKRDASAALSANPSQSSLRRVGAGASSMASSLDGLAPSPNDSPNLSPKDKKAVRSVNFCDKGDGTTSAPSQSNLYRMSSSTCWFTATVGRKTTQARHFCADVDEVTQLLKKLASKAIMGSFSRFASMPLIAPDSDQDDHEDSQDERPDVTAVGRATTHSSFLKKPLNKTDV